MSTSRPANASRMARWWLAALTLVALVLLAVPAAAAGYVEDAAAGLRSVPVYVDQRAAAIVSEQGASELRDSVAKARTPIFIAVLPAAARQEAWTSACRPRPTPAPLDRAPALDPPWRW